MKYGLIGEKLGHSFSAEIHSRLESNDYVLQELSANEIESFFKEKDFCGINVTIPYKQTVIPYLDDISPRAREIGAVNTVVNKNGALYGDNTDFCGLKRLIEKTVGVIAEKKVLILGSGGTSKTALAVAKDMGASVIHRVSRSGKEDAVTYEYAYEKLTDTEILINTTPVGMFPNVDGMPVDIDKFPSLCGVIDVIYNPISTKLVLKAKERGIPASGALYMLVCQAVAASEMFCGVKYPEALWESIYKELLTKKQNIVLTGMPSSGKTTVGKIIAEKTGRSFYDIDDEIVKTAGMDIPAIFSEKGEEYFRNLESAEAKRLSTLNGCVISCGGGTVLRQENVFALKQNGVVFFIDRPLEKLMPTADRPLSSDRIAIEKRYNERIDIYKSTCDMRITADESAEKIAEIIGKEFFN